jgi:hypothetical protein
VHQDFRGQEKEAKWQTTGMGFMESRSKSRNRPGMLSKRLSGTLPRESSVGERGVVGVREQIIINC